MNIITRRLYDTILDLMYMGEINIHTALELIKATKYVEKLLKIYYKKI
jgi:hypothetical protein